MNINIQEEPYTNEIKSIPLLVDPTHTGTLKPVSPYIGLSAEGRGKDLNLVPVPIFI